MTAAGRCTSTTPTSSPAPSARGSAGRASSFVALDGKSYEVDGDMCVIADDRAVLGLGGRDRRRGDRRSPMPPPTSSSSWPISIRSARRAPDAKLGIVSDAQLQFRARRRSRFRRAGARACHRDGARALRRRAEQDRTTAGSRPNAQQAVRIRSGLVERLSGLELEHRRHQAAARRARHRARRQGQTRQGRAAVRGGRTFTAPPTSSRRWSGSRASIRCRRRRCRARPAWPSRC